MSAVRNLLLGLASVLVAWGVVESGLAILNGEGIGSPLAVLGSGVAMGLLLCAVAALPACVGLWLLWRRSPQGASERQVGLAAGVGAALALIALLHALWLWNVHACQYVPSSRLRLAGSAGMAACAAVLAVAVAALAGRLRGGAARALPVAGPAVALVILALAGIRVALTLGAGAADGPGGPNVLLLTLDTVRADHTSPYGRSTGTPALQELADEGTVFLNAICHLPLTGPSHASLLTGLLPRRHDARVNGFPIDPGTPLVTEVLRGAGYRTAAFVSGYPLKRRNCGLDRGFDVYDDTLGTLDRFGHLLVVRILDRLGMLDGVERRADVCTDRCLEWLSANRGGRFFIWVHYFDAHTPYDPPAEFRTLAGRERQVDLYDGEIAYVDRQMGRVLRALDEYGLATNTLVVAVADHGESLGEHGIYYDHGGDLYDPALRVPLVMRLPGRVPAGVRVADAAGLTDVAPTLLALVGLAPDFACDGLDLGPSWRGGPLKREWVLAEQFRPESVVDRVAIRGGGWKAIRSDGVGATEVYALGEDPGETNDLARAQPARAAGLAGQLSAEDARMGPSGVAKRVVRLDRRQKEKLKSLGYAR